MFHARLNDQKYDQVYEDGSLSLKTSRGPDVVQSYLTSVRSRFGAFGKVSHSELNIKENGRLRLAEYQIYPGTITPSKGVPH